MSVDPGGARSTDNEGFGARRWRWFVAWFLVGALYALAVLGALTIGIFVLPVAVVATVLLARVPTARIGSTGLVSGAGLPLLYVAWLNRDGPGTVCTSTSSSSSCIDEWSPWPFVAVGSRVGRGRRGAVPPRPFANRPVDRTGRGLASIRCSSRRPPARGSTRSPSSSVPRISATPSPRARSPGGRLPRRDARARARDARYSTSGAARAATRSRSPHAASPSTASTCRRSSSPWPRRPPPASARRSRSSTCRDPRVRRPVRRRDLSLPGRLRPARRRRRRGCDRPDRRGGPTRRRGRGQRLLLVLRAALDRGGRRVRPRRPA